MSKIGFSPITVPSSVTILISDKNLKVTGPKGELSFVLPVEISLSFDEQTREMNVLRSSEVNNVKALHGLWRSLIANAIHGVISSWSKRLTVVGTGFRVKTDGSGISLEVGYSHPVKFSAPEGISITIEGTNTIIITGIDKQRVGEIAKNIKAIKKQDPYKGKGVRYEGEFIKVKPGKKSKA